MKLSKGEWGDLFAMFKLPVFQQIKWDTSQPEHTRAELEALFAAAEGDLSRMCSTLMNSADAFPTATGSALILAAKTRLRKKGQILHGDSSR